MPVAGVAIGSSCSPGTTSAPRWSSSCSSPARCSSPGCRCGSSAFAALLAGGLTRAAHAHQRQPHGPHHRPGCPTSCDAASRATRRCTAAGGWPPAAGAGSGSGRAARSGPTCRRRTTTSSSRSSARSSGCIGTLLVLGLFGLLAFAMIRVIRRHTDPFVQITTGAILCWIIGQALVNIAVVIGLRAGHRRPAAAGLGGRLGADHDDGRPRRGHLVRALRARCRRGARRPARRRPPLARRDRAVPWLSADRAPSVLLAGGGTAGHVNPLLAVADELRRRHPDARLTVLGTAEGLEARLVPEHGLPLAVVPRVPLPRRPTLDWFRLPGRGCATRSVPRAPRSTSRAPRWSSASAGTSRRPPTSPRAAAGIPVVVHEQNARPGLANRLGARWARSVAVTFPGTAAARARRSPACRCGRRSRGLVEQRPDDRGGHARRGRRRARARPGAAHAARLRRVARCRERQHRRRGRRGGPARRGRPGAAPDGRRQGRRRARRARRRARRRAVPRARVPRPRCSSRWPSPTSWSGAPARARCASWRRSASRRSTSRCPIGNGEQRLNAAAVVAAGGGLLVDDADLDPAWVRAHLPGPAGRRRRARRRAQRMGRRRGARSGCGDARGAAWPGWSRRSCRDGRSLRPADLGRVHLVGVGGAGMSAIAALLAARGWPSAAPTPPTAPRCRRCGTPGVDGARRPRRRARRRRRHRRGLLGRPRVQPRARPRARARPAGAAPVGGARRAHGRPGRGRRRRRARQDDDVGDDRHGAAARGRRPVVRDRRHGLLGRRPARRRPRRRGPGVRRRGRRVRRLVPRVRAAGRGRHERRARPPRPLRHRARRSRRRSSRSPARIRPGGTLVACADDAGAARLVDARARRARGTRRRGASPTARRRTPTSGVGDLRADAERGWAFDARPPAT